MDEIISSTFVVTHFPKHVDVSAVHFTHDDEDSVRVVRYFDKSHITKEQADEINDWLATNKPNKTRLYVQDLYTSTTLHFDNTHIEPLPFMAEIKVTA